MSLAQMLAAADPSAVWPPYMGAQSALGIPGVGRAIGIYRSIGQMPLQRYRGITPLATTRLLERPDPDRSGSWFLSRNVDDYLLHGNAVHLVTGRDADGRPATVLHLPAQRVTLLQDPRRPFSRPTYMLDGQPLPGADVVHVQRGEDPAFPWRGIGVLEQHLRSLARVYGQESYESQTLTGSGVPSVVVVAPNQHLSDDEINASLDQWDQLYGGPTRRPAILPAGTQVTPLAWSPTDSQLNEARGLSLTDLANAFNLDGYWLGAQTSSHTYRTPGPMFTVLMRLSLGPVCTDLEQEWSEAWLPRGQRLRLDRTAIEQDTMAATISALSMGMTTIGADGEPLLTTAESRAKLGLAITDTTLGAAASVPSALPTTGGE